jgi:preprotein translocase subunit SecY
MKFIDTIKNIWKIDELRNRIILTLTLLLVYRFGAQVVLPGIDASQLGGLQDSAGQGLLGLLSAFTGGAFSNALYFCFDCSTVNGYCNTLFTKTTEGGRKWSS